MQDNVFIKNYLDVGDFDRAEILRYARCNADEAERIRPLLEACLQECKDAFSYRVCYRLFDVKRSGVLHIGDMATDSVALKERLDGCAFAVVFAATVGLGVDRLIERYGGVYTLKALLFQAIGAERIESLCERFCKEIGNECGMRGYATAVRFSPGYGDLALETQRWIFRALDCSRKIGVTLTDSLLMSPTKSVTAVIGVRKAD